MFKVVGEQTPETRKLVLGFDAGCGTCSDLAGRVQERVGDKLSVENLNDPQLMAWREETLGKDAKWAPTLFEVDGERVVRAWTGWKMGWALSRKLGPTSTWQVMQALGEVGAAPRIEDSPIVEKLPERAAAAVVGMSRGQFLKGIGGAVVATSVLSGTNLLATPAMAATTELSPYDIVKMRKIAGPRLMRLALHTAKNRDVKNLAGTALSTDHKVRLARSPGFLQTLRNGNTVEIVTYQLSKARILIHFQYRERPTPGQSSLAKLWQKDGNKWVLVKASEGGHLWRKDQSYVPAQAGQITPLGDCPPVGGGGNVDPPTGNCWLRVRECCDYELTSSCIESIGNAGFACAACGLAIFGSYKKPWRAIATISTVCGGCGWTAGWAAQHCCVSHRYVTRYVCIPR